MAINKDSWDEVYSDFMLKKILVPFQFCYEPASATSTSTFLTLLSMLKGWSLFWCRVLHPDFITLFPCFSSFIWEDRDGNYRHELCREFYIHYFIQTAWQRCSAVVQILFLPVKLMHRVWVTWLLLYSYSWPYYIQVFIISCYKPLYR